MKGQERAPRDRAWSAGQHAVDTHSISSTATHDSAEIIRALRLILAPEQVAELRVLDAVTTQDRRPHIESGYFDGIEKLAEAAATVKTAKGFYFTPNPVNPALLARAVNRIRPAGKEPTTADHDIIGRRWLLIDCDPERPAGISSTDGEHQAAIERAFAIRAALAAECWPEPIVGDSGNGAHLLYRIDLPADDGGLVKRCLEALAERFDAEQVSIDTTVHNPARIWKLYGSVSAKGENTPERPHRLARILEAPASLAIVDMAHLESLAAQVPASPPEQQRNCTPRGQSFDIDRWIREQGLAVDGPEPWQGGRKWVLRVCPWNPDHTNRSAFIVQQASGAIGAGCQHNGCRGKGWHDLRDFIEPGWRSRPKKQSPEHKLSQAARPNPPPAYVPFPVGMLPEPCRRFVSEAADAIGCDASFVALPLLACLARAIGNSRTIKIKRTWQEPAVIWGAIVGKSGTHKSPALQAATSILQQKQAEAIARHDEALQRFAQEWAEYDRALAQWKRSKSTEPPPWEPKEPVCPRYIVGDITIEALADRLAGQSDGVAVVRDELAGWLDGMAEYKGGKGSDTGHWLATWSAAPLTVDRKTGAKKMIHIARAAVNIVGGIQPGILRRAIGREHLHDGLCARLLLVMPPPRPVRWSEATVSPATEAALGWVFDGLLALEPAADGQGNPAPFAMPLTSEAKQRWVDFYNRHRAEMANLDDDLAAAWSKLEAYAARFALIHQLCSCVSGDASPDVVDQAAIDAGITLAEWFGNEAKRVYGVLVETDEERETRELVGWMRRHGGEATIRDLTRGPRQYRDANDAEAALNGLATAGLGHWTPTTTGPTGGHPTRTFRLATHGDGDKTPMKPEENKGCVTVATVTGAEINDLLAEAGEVDGEAVGCRPCGQLCDDGRKRVVRYTRANR